MFMGSARHLENYLTWMHRLNITMLRNVRKKFYTWQWHLKDGNKKQIIHVNANILTA